MTTRVRVLREHGPNSIRELYGRIHSQFSDSGKRRFELRGSVGQAAAAGEERIPAAADRPCCGRRLVSHESTVPASIPTTAR